MFRYGSLFCCRTSFSPPHSLTVSRRGVQDPVQLLLARDGAGAAAHVPASGLLHLQERLPQAQIPQLGAHQTGNGLLTDNH